MSTTGGDCNHVYRYQGTVYWNGEYMLRGSDAYPRVYGDRYFCERCLNVRTLNERTHGNSYQNPLPGTLPK